MKNYAQTDGMKRLLIVLATFTLMACGYTDDDNSVSPAATPSPTNAATPPPEPTPAPEPIPATFTGVAAKGAAMAKATVSLTDNSGKNLSTTTDATGKYDMTCYDLTPPFAVAVTDGNDGTHYSVSMDTGCINVTPLTGAIASALLGGADPSSIVEQLSTVTAEKITTAQNELKAAIDLLLEAFGVEDLDLICGEFSANSRGIDALLDIIRVEIDGASGTLTLKATTGQVLMEASLNAAGATVTTPLTEATLSTIPELTDKLYGDHYHVVDFNASTTDEAAEVNWGSARFTADGYVTLTFTHTNNGTAGRNVHAYSLSTANILEIGGDTGMQGSVNSDKSLIVLSDVSTNDGDTGIVFFMKKNTETPAISGDYALMSFTRNDTGQYETDSWPDTLAFTWDANNKEAAYVDEGSPATLAYGVDGSLSGPDGLTVFQVCDGAILVAPHASPDDPGITLLVKKPTAPFPDFSDTNVNAMADFVTPGVVINTESHEFKGHRNMMLIGRQTDTFGALSLGSIVSGATIQCTDGIFQKMNGATPEAGFFGIYPHQGIFLWVDEKEGSSDNNVGLHVGFRTSP